MALRVLLTAAVTLVLALLPPTRALGAADSGLDEAALQALEWRHVGPFRGGRSAAVTGIAAQPEVYYFGAAGGGVWKTTDSGLTWNNVSDGFFGGSIGAVAVSEWDPNVIYVGGGEKTVRGNVSHGLGVWKSKDAGKTWHHVGLDDSRRIPRLRIHPRNPDLVYAAVLGHLFGPNEMRGIFRSQDGGETWEKVLYVSDRAGAVELTMDPTNPRVLYASFWQVQRTPWSLASGGEGSGMWKSTDGGDSWDELTDNPGLPSGPLGINAVTVSPSNPENLYALIEAKEGGVFRSKDGGETWERTNQDRKLRQRAWYYTRLYADPADEESLWVLNVRLQRSKDGGKTFAQVATPHGDNHDLWIDPRDPLRMIEANDGGAAISSDGGNTWSRQDNQPTAQIYRVSVDSDFPYRLLGGQQDNSALRIRSRSAWGSAIGKRDWEPTSGGESGHIVAKPDDPDIVYGGSYGGFLTRFDHRTGQRQAVNVWPDNPMGWGAAELAYRFQWNFPIFFSPHDPEILYAASNVLHRSGDGGRSWQDISPDLTRNDSTKMGSSGGPITQDNTSIEYYGTIFAAVESPHEPGVLWTGSDDGLVQISRDRGQTWNNVTPQGLGEWTMINSLDPHPFEPGGLYLAATRYKLDDFEPLLYRTTDYGKSWRRITDGIEPQHFTRVIRADPARRGLLYAGTELGIYVSFDDGAHWQTLQLELPVVPITDLAVKGGDLVAATQGRGFWILDDLSPLHQLDVELAAKPLHLLKPRPTWRLPGGRREVAGAGLNPPDGVLFYFLLNDELAQADDLLLEVLESDGTLIRSFAPKQDPDEKDKGKENKEDEVEPADDPHQLEIEPGLNRFAWNLRYGSAETLPKLVLWNGQLAGPKATPGTYRARLSAAGNTAEVTFEVRADPRASATAEDYRAQHALLISLRNKLSETHREIRRLRQVRDQLGKLLERLPSEPSDEASQDSDSQSKTLRTQIETLSKQLGEIEKALYQTQNKSPQDPLNFPIRLNDKLAGLMSLADLGDHPPTASMLRVRDQLITAIDGELTKLRLIWEQELPAINRLAREQEVVAIQLPQG